MKGDTRCVEGRLYRHDPQYDDPDLETDIGKCSECDGEGCDRTFTVTVWNMVEGDIVKKVWSATADEVAVLEDQYNDEPFHSVQVEENV